MNAAFPATLDVIYVATCARDARLARICIASIRRIYPEIPIRILVGGKLETGQASELARYWDVQASRVPPGEWGWGFVKLEPLFGPPGERFMVVDADTAFSGPVLEKWNAEDAPFLFDDEEQSEANMHRLYYDWRQVAAIDPAALPPLFVFNTGQWFGTSGILSRADFDPLVDYSVMPPQLRYPGIFRNGEQGVLNYVINQKIQRNGLGVQRSNIMRWPGLGMDDLTLDSLREGTAPALVIHWAGMKAIRLQDMTGGDLLQFFEDSYYARLPLGRLRRRLGVWRHASRSWAHKQFTPYRLFMARLRK